MQQHLRGGYAGRRDVEVMWKSWEHTGETHRAESEEIQTTGRLINTVLDI